MVARLPEGNFDSSQCCFGDMEDNNSITCSNAENIHRFCFECARRYAETEMGKGKLSPRLNNADDRTALICIDGLGCSASFSEVEIRRLLDARALKYYDNLHTAQMLRQVTSVLAQNIADLRLIFRTSCTVPSATLRPLCVARTISSSNAATLTAQ